MTAVSGNMSFENANRDVIGKIIDSRNDDLGYEVKILCPVCT